MTDPSRRDILHIAAGATGAIGVVGAVGGAAFLVLGRDDGAPQIVNGAVSETVDVDLSPLSPGQQITVFWRSWPVFVSRRTPLALKSLQDQALREQLADPDSRELQQPPYAAAAHRSIKPEFAVLLGVCTHMACTPSFYPQPDAREPELDWLGGYLCMCHGSKYDLAGRVFKDVPAPYNLPVPPYRFVNAQTIRIGENPPNMTFDFNSILQI